MQLVELIVPGPCASWSIMIVQLLWSVMLILMFIDADTTGQ